MDKRMFFGLEVAAPWPHKLPSGRLLDEQHRHLTVAFLGQTDFEKLMKSLSRFPKPPFQVAPSGKFSQCLLLPPRHPRVVAWQADWMDEGMQEVTHAYQRQFIDWLKQEGFHPDDRHAEWLPHATLARSPFNAKEWKENFEELPFIVTNLHLYESLGNLQYEPHWSWKPILPFEEIEHTADIAFLVRGENIRQLFKNAFVAMTFHCPSALAYYALPAQLQGLDDLIYALNALVAKIDSEIGIPLKAVSYHGEIVLGPSNILEWEMIIDV